MNRPRIAGTRFESAVVAYLLPRGWPRCERRALRGINDAGDLVGVDGWLTELKAERALDPTTALKEAEKAAKRHGGWPVAILKRRNQPVGKALVCMTLETWVEARKGW